MVTHPLEVHAEIIASCALACRHCSTVSLPGTRGSVAVDVVCRLLEAAHGRGCAVYLTGGEPLMSPMLAETVGILAERSTSVGLLTSGCIGADSGIRPLSVAGARELSRVGVQIVYVSVYSDTAAVHDWVTGRKGSLDTAVRSIAAFREAGIDVRLNVPLLSPTIGVLRRLPHFAVLVGATEIRILRAVKHGSAAVNWQSIGADVETQSEAARQLEALAKELPGDLRITVAGFPGLFDCRPAMSIPGCPAGVASFFVTLQGEVVPCACVKRRGPYLDVAEALRIVESWTETRVPSFKCRQDA